MKKIKILLTNTVLFCSVDFSFAMNSLSLSEQHKINIICADGDYALDRWKICASRTLHEHHCKNKKEYDKHQTLPMFPSVTRSEIDLWSKCLDYTPGNGFSNYVNSLSNQDKLSLIFAVGEHGLTEGEKKLDDPGTTAQLVDWFFPSEVKHLIKPKNDLEEIYHDCKKIFIKRSSFLSSFWPDIRKSTSIVYNSNSSAMFVVPQGLDIIFYDGQKCFFKEMLDDDERDIYYCKNVGDIKYYISGTTVPGSNEVVYLSNKRACFLWAVRENVVIGKVLLECKSNFIDCVFSNDGKYVAVYSGDQIVLTKMGLNKHNKAIFESIVINQEKSIKSLLFNNKSTNFIMVSHTDGMGNIKVWDLSGNIVGVLQAAAQFSDVLIRSDDTALSFFAYDGQSFFMTYRLDEFCDDETYQIAGPKIVQFNMPDKRCRNIGKDTVIQLFCSPVNNSLLAITKKGGIVWGDNAFDSSLFMLCCTRQYEGIIAINKRFVVPLSEYKVWSIFDNSRSGLPLLLIVDMVDGRIIKDSSIGTRDTDGIGLLSDQKSIIANFGDNKYEVKELLQDEDAAILKWIKDESTLLQSLLLYRLYQKYKNNAKVVLYEEEPLYKALQLLPADKKCDVISVIKKHLSPHKVADNKLGFVNHTEDYC